MSEMQSMFLFQTLKCSFYWHIDQRCKSMCKSSTRSPFCVGTDFILKDMSVKVCFSSEKDLLVDK